MVRIMSQPYTILLAVTTKGRYTSLNGPHVRQQGTNNAFMLEGMAEEGPSSPIGKAAGIVLPVIAAILQNTRRN